VRALDLGGIANECLDSVAGIDETARGVPPHEPRGACDHGLHEPSR